MKKNILSKITTLLAVSVLAIGFSTNAQAYSCNKIFKEADGLITKAEAMVDDKTDSRIKAMLAEARGLANAGLVSHKAASQKHVGDVGKYAHGDSVRKGRWAVSLAKEALFLLSGTPQ